MQLSGCWQVLFAIASSGKVDTDIQDWGGKSASRRCSHQHHKTSISPLPQKWGLAMMDGNGATPGLTCHLLPLLHFSAQVVGLTFPVPWAAEGHSTSLEETGQGSEMERNDDFCPNSLLHHSFSNGGGGDHACHWSVQTTSPGRADSQLRWNQPDVCTVVEEGMRWF